LGRDAGGPDSSARTASRGIRQVDRHRVGWHFLLLAGCLGGPWAQAGRAVDAIPLKSVSGVICTRALLQTGKAEVPAYVVVDLGTRGPLLVHYPTAALLRIGNQGRVDVLIEGSNVILPGLQAVAQALKPLETLTRDHAAELEDIPAAAVLGLPAFSGMRIELDLGAAQLGLLQRGAAPSGAWNREAVGPEAPGSAWPESKATTLNYTAEAYGYWLEADGPDGTAAGKLRVRLATSEFDTRIEARTVERLDRPGGNLDRLMLGSVDLTRYAVLRPSDLSRFPEPRPDLILGTGFLSRFLVTIDPDQQQITLVPTRESQLALAEREFFVARARTDPARIEAFLEAYPESRLLPEASEALLAQRLAQLEPSRDAIRQALMWRARSARPERRAMTLVQIADDFIALGDERDDAYELALLALEGGEPYAADDLNATAVYHIHARRGLIALLRDDHTQARRHLLSAAFGIPKDPYVNLWLGRLYEKTGQLPRAWSRYLESALRERPPIGALQGLDRLNRDPNFRAHFTMADAERLLEGRVPALIPARRYEHADRAGPVPVKLVELFTSVNEPSTQAAQLAFDGLAEYFRMVDTVLVQYHIGDVLESDASDTRAAFYGLPGLPAAYFDGIGPVTEGGEHEAAAGVFSAYRERCISQAGVRSVPPDLRGVATGKGDHIQVHVQVGPTGTDTELALHAILCEQAVMVIGANGQVLHRHVARRRLSPPQGWLVSRAGDSETFTVSASVAEIRQSLEHRLDRLAEREARPFPIRPTWIDLNACEVRAFLLLLSLLLIGLLVNISLTYQALVAVKNLSASSAQRGSLPCEALPVRFFLDHPTCAEKLLRAMNVTNVRIVENASELSGLFPQFRGLSGRCGGGNWPATAPGTAPFPYWAHNFPGSSKRGGEIEHLAGSS
jgi:tetratricopeptide (TPR) repeat protein